MRTSITRALTVVLTAGCAGCDIASPRVCTSIAVFGISVRVEDAATGAPIAKDARIVVTDGTYADSSSAPAPNDLTPLFAVGDRAGVYSVTVRKPGYVTWTQSGVEVTTDGCHVKPANLTATLSKL